MFPGVLLKEFFLERYLGVELLNHKESKNPFIWDNPDDPVYAPASIADPSGPQL